MNVKPQKNIQNLNKNPKITIFFVQLAASKKCSYRLARPPFHLGRVHVFQVLDIFHIFSVRPNPITPRLSRFPEGRLKKECFGLIFRIWKCQHISNSDFEGVNVCLHTFTPLGTTIIPGIPVYQYIYIYI